MKNGKRFGKVIATILTALLACFLLPQASSSYVVEGTPTLQAISDTVESTEPVCYIGSTFYTSIEGALTVAGNNSSADTVYVIPGVTATISKDCTIASGDTLCLPYSATLDESTNTYSGETYTNGDNYTSSTSGDAAYAAVVGFADQFIDSIDNYRKSLVIIDEDVTLTIDGGSLIVGGFTGYYSVGQAGSTSQDYCEILMLADSRIVANESSSITCYGYIKEATYIEDDDGKWNLTGSLNNGSSITMSCSSSVLCPLVIYDYKGGSVTATMIYYSSPKVCPFELFDLPNIQVELILNSDGSKTTAFKGQYKLVASGDPFTGSIDAVGYSSGMIKLTSGSMSIKYTPRLAGFTQKLYGFSSYESMPASLSNGTMTTSERSSTSLTNMSMESPDNCSYTTFTINGEAALSSFSISLSVSILSLSVNTANFDLPISYRMRFTVGNGTDPASFAVDNKVKAMPGSEITVNENASASINSSLILYPSYKNYEYSYWNGSSATVFYYPTSFDDAYLLNNGTITLTSSGSFGGTVHTTVAGAVFDALAGSLSVTSTYGKTYGYSIDISSALSFVFGSYSDVDTITQSAQGYIVDADGYTTNSITKFENKFYAGTSNPAGYWFETDPVNITWIVESNSNAVDDIAFSVNGMTVTYVNGVSSYDSVQVGKGTTVNLGNVRGVSSFSVGGMPTTQFTATDDMTVTITPMTATATLNVNYVYSNTTSKFSVVVSNGKVSLTVASLSLSSSGTYKYNCLEGETYSIEDTSYVKSVSPGETGSISSTTDVYIYGTTTHTLTVDHQGESFGLGNYYHAYPNYYLTYCADNSLVEETMYTSQGTSTYTVDEGTTVSITGFMTNTSGYTSSYNRSYCITSLSTSAGDNISSTKTTYTYSGTEYTAITLTFTMTADAKVTFSFSY